MKSGHLFRCSRSLVSWDSVWCWKLPHAVVRRTLSSSKCRHNCSMAVSTENPADCEVQGVISFLQADKVFGYLAEEASSCVELFSCTTMHVRILPGRHKPCCESNSTGTSLIILRTARNWHCQTFSWFQKWRSSLLVNASQTKKTWRMLGE